LKVRGTPQTIGRALLGGRQVEAKYPALLFKQQLTAFLEKIYGMIRDNLKKEISPLLGLCIQVLIRIWNISCCLFGLELKGKIIFELMENKL
jgi:hypothetical protein